MKANLEPDIINWLDILNDFKKYKVKNSKKLYNNVYFLFFMFFKYLIFKDLCFINQKLLFEKYNFNLYNNIIECRFYYIFFFIILRNNMYDYIDFFYTESIIFSKELLKSKFNIFFFNNYIYLYIYLLKYLHIFLIKYNKFNFYKNYKLLNNFFFFKEFILKVDYNNFFLYRKYIEYFRIFKYNEYLSNNKIFFIYPKLKKILHIPTYNIKNYDIIYRKNTLIHFFNIYKSITKNIIYNYKNIWWFNEFSYIKLLNIDFLKFLDLLNNFYYKNLFNLIYPILAIYIAYTSYNIYHYLNLKRFKCRHIISLHWKFNLAKLNFFPFLFKNFYILFTQKLFQHLNLINYGFISYYFLENNNYIRNFIKKNILLYKITHLLLIEYISFIFENIHWDLNIESHKFKKFSHPDVQKMWQINFIKNPINSRKKKIAPIFTNKQDSSYKNIYSIIGLNDIPYNLATINSIYKFLWEFIYNWSILIFSDILNIVTNNKIIIKLICNFKYSLEFISWEILNSNNNFYITNKYFLNFNYLIKNIKIDNIIVIYLKNYINNILIYFSKYTKNYFIDSSFLFLVIRDLFFRILSKKKKGYYITSYIKKKKLIINKYNLFYYKFFFWQLQCYLSIKRFWLYYNKYKKYYKDYDFYNIF